MHSIHHPFGNGPNADKTTLILKDYTIKTERNSNARTEIEFFF